jgi:hypothetical protein
VDFELPGLDVAGNIDEPASAFATAGTVNDGDTDNIKQCLFPVSHPALFGNGVMTADALNFRSRLLMDVFRHRLFTNTEG